MIHPLIIVFDCENSFHPSGAIQESFQFDSPKAIISGLFILSFQLLFSKSYRCIIQIFYNQLVISSFSCIKFPQVSSFIFQFFSVNWAFATSISNSYGGSFKNSLPLLLYQFIRSFQILPVFVEVLLKFTLYLS